LPSRSDSFGLVLLEAWANGVPNVAYRAGGGAEGVRPEQDGPLVRGGDVAGLSAAISRLTGGAECGRGPGQTGRERTGREFRWADKLRRVRDVYQDLVTERAEGTGGAMPQAAKREKYRSPWL